MSKQSDRAISRLNGVMTRATAGFAPPEGLTVSQWADKHRRLSSEASAEPGPWRTKRTPYLKAPMDAFTDPTVRRIVMVAASQVGKSELLNNIIGYVMHQDPGSMLFIQPTTIDAKEYSKLRIAPMIRDTPALRRRVAESKSRDSGNTILQKSYPGGILTLCGSTEAHALASKPIRYILGDERDRWATSAGGEGDPWELAMARQTTFYNAKAVEVSTATVKGASAIETSFAQGTMERWCSLCPHCGEYSEIRFTDISYQSETTVIDQKRTHQLTSVYYVCPKCGAISEERTMKSQPAQWMAENPQALAHGVRSFWLNAFVSPWATWESIVLKYLYAEGNSKKLQVVYNTAFGELWEDRGDLEEEGNLLARREDYGTHEDGTPVELPDGVLVLTCGVDTQDDRLEYEVVGRGLGGETWGIEKGTIIGRPDSNEVWEQLDDRVVNRTFHFSDGVGLPVAWTFVDEGGHFTQQVRLRCRARVRRNVFAIKGKGGEHVPYTEPPKKYKIVLNQRTVGGVWCYHIGVDSGKQTIMDDIRVQSPGGNYCHFPLREDYGSGYFKSLLSERKVYNPERKQPWTWEKIPGHERNEALDCRNYANAAFVASKLDLNLAQARLERARGKPTKQSPTPKPTNRRPSVRRELADEW